MPLVNEAGKGAGVICTYSGKLVDLNNIKPSDVELIDIAHSLSLCNRWHGATDRAYSVASHSLVVCDAVFRNWMHTHIPLAALLHDAAEAYLVDVPAPIKMLGGFEAYKALETKVSAAIAHRFDLDPAAFHHPAVVDADKLAAKCEAFALVKNSYKWAGDKPLDATIKAMVRPRSTARKEKAQFLRMALMLGAK